MQIKYRVIVIVEKYEGDNIGQVILENSVAYDDFKTANRLFVWLVGMVSKFKMENGK